MGATPPPTLMMFMISNSSRELTHPLSSARGSQIQAQAKMPRESHIIGSFLSKNY